MRDVRAVLVDGAHHHFSAALKESIVTDMSGHPRPGGEPNDPKWKRWEGIAVCEGSSEPGGIPTLGLGWYRCNCCHEPNFCLAIVHPDGREFSIVFSPHVMSKVLVTASEGLAEMGINLIALEALRARAIVSDLAAMTDIEADFVDGAALREACRLSLKGGPFTLPRLYSSGDRERAVDAIREINAGRKSGTELRQMVDLVAAALGLTPASA